MNNEALHAAALAVRERAHAPYSGFRVGAALFDERGQMHVGCNVENAAYPEGTCAEAGAIAAMVAAGGSHIREIVVVGGRDGIVACSPCGGCRQRIREFTDVDSRIWMVDETGELVATDIEALLPAGFTL